MPANNRFASTVRWLLAALLMQLTSSAFGDLADKMGRLVGYTIVDSKTIEGWRDRSRGKSGDSFEGCEHGRLIVFTDGQALACNTYSYSYSYRPTAVILARQLTYQGKSFYAFRMIVGDEIYDMESR